MQLGMSAGAVGCWLLAVQLDRTAFGHCICTQGYMLIDILGSFDLDGDIVLLSGLPSHLVKEIGGKVVCLID